jgi:hypothetical protein
VGSVERQSEASQPLQRVGRHPHGARLGSEQIDALLRKRLAILPDPFTVTI